MKEQKFEAVEKHLYKRQYQTATGEWSTLFYGILTLWNGERPPFALGSDLQAARDRLGEIRNLNRGRHNFDGCEDERCPCACRRTKAKRQQAKAKAKAMLLSEWLDKYLDLCKDMHSYRTKKAQCGPLKRLMGHLTVAEAASRVRIMEYRSRRTSERLTRHGEAVKGTKITGATVNREVSCLITALNLAADEGLCEGAPKVKKERETARERILTDAEYAALLDRSDRWLQRVEIAADETGFDQSAILNATWDWIQAGLFVVKGGRAKTGARQRVGISPALAEVLNELRAEYKRTPNVERRIFTRGGRAIPKATLRHAFDKAVKDAEIDDFQFRDFRHCARTRWAAMGLPFEVGEIGIGHKLRGVAARYVNLSDEQIREVFQEMFTRCLHRKNAAADSNEGDAVNA